MKQYLAENISVQRSNCNIFLLTDTVALFTNEARFFQILGVLPGMFSQKRWTLFFHTSNPLSYSGKYIRKKIDVAKGSHERP